MTFDFLIALGIVFLAYRLGLYDKNKIMNSDNIKLSKKISFEKDDDSSNEEFLNILKKIDEYNLELTE